MMNDPKRHSRVTTHSQRARWNVFFNMHKATRRVLCDTLAYSGSVDAFDGREMRSLVARVHDMLSFVQLQVELETEQLKAALPALGPMLESTGARRLAALDNLRSTCRTLDLAKGDARPPAMQLFYQDLTHLVAYDMRAMLDVEDDANAMLWQHFNDDELRELEASLFALVSASELYLWLHWMIPALDPAARIRALECVRTHVPVRTFTELLAMLGDEMPAYAHRALVSHFSNVRMPA